MVPVVVGGEPLSLETSSLLAHARRKSGLDDYGDMAFVDALERFVAACAATGRLNEVGHRVLPRVLSRHLMNRLYLREYVVAHPEVTATLPQVAVVVTGLPRTGTTLLHNLLALDPDNRYLRLWEALHPVPPSPGGRHSAEALVDRAQAWLAGLYELAPEFRKIHPATAQGPEECDALLQNDFVSQHLEDMVDVEAYSRWLDGTQLLGAYEYYAQQVKIISTSCATERGWVMKSPSHLAHLAALCQILPGAKVVMCHRSPVEAVASYASLVHTVRSPYSDVERPGGAGVHALQRCAVAMDRALAARRELPAERFVDVSYRRLVADPIGLVTAVYERLDRAIAPGFRASMEAWLAQNPQHKHGVHRYALSDFALGEGAIRDRFASYLSQWGPLLTGSA